ncbi:MAG: hypothetical protein ACTSQA_05240 [Candidatus Heimdallarchaeaceae archaeon]
MKELTENERRKQRQKECKRAFEEMAWALKKARHYMKELELELTKLKLEKEMKENQND